MQKKQWVCVGVGVFEWLDATPAAQLHRTATRCLCTRTIAQHWHGHLHTHVAALRVSVCVTLCKWNGNGCLMPVTQPFCTLGEPCTAVQMRAPYEQLIVYK